VKPVVLIFIIATIYLNINAHAQDSNTGDVHIHTDPRLAVLVRKYHTYVRLTRPEPVKTPPPPLTPPPASGPDSYTSNAGVVHRDIKTVFNGRGYRVQIYYGPDRAKAMQVKAEFMRRNPGVRAYLIYQAPSFRVRVGNYRNRNDAEGMLREANSMFSPSMIVPDEVSISTY